MPTTRKKTIKTVYKEEDDSEHESGDFSDSGSEAVISPPPSSEDEVDSDIHNDSEDNQRNNKIKKNKSVRNLKLNKVPKRSNSNTIELNCDPDNEPVFSVKDLTDADKLLPSFLNLSESDSSDEEDTCKPSRHPITHTVSQLEEIEEEKDTEYKDVWSSNLKQSEEIAQRAFLELQQHKSKLEETEQTIKKYTGNIESKGESDVKDLLALGEEVPSPQSKLRKQKHVKARNDSDSDVEDWEEVAEGKMLPQQGLQLVVDFPDAVGRKSKKLDVEMMMKRKINRVKKEYQIYMHKVHVLCWIGHGNFVSQALNDQEVLSAALSLIPSKECYPGEIVDMKYVEQITTWFKDKLNIKYDKNEGKYRPKLPPLKTILLEQIKSRNVTSKKYIVFIFVSMLRAVGLQCRIMLNFTTLPIKPPATELCSLSTKANLNKERESTKSNETKKKVANKVKGNKIPQLDGNYDSLSDSEYENIVQLDGNDDTTTSKHVKTPKKDNVNENVDDVSPPKRARRNLSVKKMNSEVVKHHNTGVKDISQANKKTHEKKEVVAKVVRKSLNRNQSDTKTNNNGSTSAERKTKGTPAKNLSLRKTRSSVKESELDKKRNDVNLKLEKSDKPKIVDTDIKMESEYFNSVKTAETKRDTRTRKRSHTAHINEKQNDTTVKDVKKSRSKSVPESKINNSKYFNNNKTNELVKLEKKNKSLSKKVKNDISDDEDSQRVSHREIVKAKEKSKNDVTDDLVKIIKKRVRAAREDTRKGNNDKSCDEDSDYLLEITESQKSTAKKIVKTAAKRKIDRRVLSTDDEAFTPKIDVWCEVYVEELEQWIAVDVIKGRVHCVNEIYSGATHPVNYIVGWDNNNYLKDLTRRYAPHWNTVTRKQRVDPAWWNKALQPWLGPRTTRDKEEDDSLDRMQLDAPLPKSISEYKNHPLYALKRHLLKFEAIYPPDAVTLGFVRGEAVYARDCVYVCRSRDTWLKEAKVVRLGEQPYKVVKARPKWDRLSNKLITDKPLEVFGPWQVQDYEPPVAENGLVPRNAYGNVELFKECMLPKGTAHVKLPGLNRVAKKLNIDCAPAMTGFDFNGGWSHPVYDGFVVCKEFEDIIINAWHEDQLEQERKEMEKLEAKVYGNWRRLIKGLLIRERLKIKYGFSEPSTSQVTKKKSTGPRLIVKKKGMDK